MPLSFLLVLFTYLVVAAAAIRANNILSTGVINTFTLGIVLFAGMMAWCYGRRRPFWVGFLIFFAGHEILYLWKTDGYLFSFSLSNALGEFINAIVSSRPFNLERLFQDHSWYSHVANCFITTTFGIIGGLLATKALGRDVDEAKHGREASQ